MLKSVKIIRFLLINSGKLFHREGPTNEIIFYVCLKNRILSFANSFLAFVIDNLNVIVFVH